MTRRSLADTYYEEAEDEPCEAETTWLLLYDFKGIKPSKVLGKPKTPSR